jgi:hypothetical protein
MSFASKTAPIVASGVIVLPARGQERATIDAPVRSLTNSCAGSNAPE